MHIRFESNINRKCLHLLSIQSIRKAFCSQSKNNTKMQHLKNLFAKKYHLFIGGAIMFEMERSHLLPKTPLYARVKADAIQELKFTDSQTDHSQLCMETMTQEQLNLLKSMTKKKILEIQNLSRESGSTLPYTCSIIGLGVVNFFIHPTICALFVGSYLSVLVADFVKSLDVIKSGRDPLWTWKMKDLGHVMTTTFGFITLAFLTRSALAKLKEKVTKEIVLRNLGVKKE